MSRAKLLKGALVALVAMSMMPGCSFKAGQLLTHSQFVYPNSNIEILGTVAAAKSKTGFYSVSISMQDLEALYRDALAQKGGDVLVNARLDTKITMIPIPLFVPIVIVRGNWTIAGTAAKMTVGEQKISEMIDADLRRMASEGVLEGRRPATPKAGD